MLDSGCRLGKAMFKVPQPHPLVPISGSSEGSHATLVPKHTTSQDTIWGTQEIPESLPTKPHTYFKCMEHWGSSGRLGPCHRQEDSHAAHVAPKRHLGIWHKEDSFLQPPSFCYHTRSHSCATWASLHPLK